MDGDVHFRVRAFRTHRGLKKHAQLQPSSTVSICRDVSYGKAERTVLDIYIPAALTQGQSSHTSHKGPGNSHAAQVTAVPQSSNAPQSRPVAVFCHGGVWATGEKWQYAPIAHGLAQAGILTCVIQYTLYPKALAPQMVQEVSQALTWTFDNIVKHGGDPTRVSLVGHSAGAQLCSMVLLHRAKAFHRRKHSSTTRDPVIPESTDRQTQNAEIDCRMPARLIGAAGVYDIGMHYQYEDGRGVAELSTMKRAMGGFQKFASQSPAIILNAAAGRNPLKDPKQDPHPNPPAPHQQAANKSLEEDVSNTTLEDRRFGGGIKAVGRAVQSRMPGFMLGPSTSASKQVDTSSAGQPSQSTTQAASSAPSQEAASMTNQEGMMHFSLEEAGKLPPINLFSSTGDLTVPWQQSEQMFAALQACKVPVTHQVYHTISHVGFATDWPRRKPKGVPAQQDNFHQDLLEAINGTAS